MPMVSRLARLTVIGNVLATEGLLCVAGQNSETNEACQGSAQGIARVLIKLLVRVMTAESNNNVLPFRHPGTFILYR